MTLLMLRIPVASNFSLSHAGDGPTRTLVRIIDVQRGLSVASVAIASFSFLEGLSFQKDSPFVASAYGSFMNLAAIPNRGSIAAASRAIPTTDIASGLLVVISMS